jgi:biotin transport system substrate-specific component
VTPSRTFSATGLALIAVFVGIIAALGLVPAIAIPGVAVPITLQTLGVMLAGAILGRWRGTAAVLVFLLLVALGLPLLAGGRGGLGVFVGPSAGFLIGFPVAAFVIGWLTERFNAAQSLPKGIAINVFGGIVVLYAFGIVGLSIIGQLPLAKAAAVSVVFLPGDLAKAVVAALVARGVHQALPGLLPEAQPRDRQQAPSPSSRVWSRPRRSEPRTRPEAPSGWRPPAPRVGRAGWSAPPRPGWTASPSWQGCAP